MRHEKLYRSENPDTVNIQDSLFDRATYVNWLEDKLDEKLANDWLEDKLAKRSKLTVSPIRETGGSRKGTLNTDYATIVQKVGKPNVTDMDDADKVKASWGFADNKGRKGFIWCYKHYGRPETCDIWSVDGDMELLKELFGVKVS
jgi:hypothetical protein